jgi:hypothetical protein
MTKTTPSKTWAKADRTERRWWLGPVSGVDDPNLARRKYANLPTPAKKRLARTHRVAEATFDSYRTKRRSR